MEHNEAVKGTKVHPDVVRLVRFAAVLWIGYLVVLALIDLAFPGPRRTGVLQYVLPAFVPLICLGLVYWRWAQERLRQAFIPLIVGVITVMPVVATWVTRLLSAGPPLGFESMGLRLLPFFIVAFLLVAWQYRWQYTVFVIMGMAGLNLLVVWISARPGAPPFQGVLIITSIQTVIFLAVGSSISYLMSRLRRQQQSLEDANIRLAHHASTLEQLATSRERNRLALELHDTMAHALSGLSVQLEAVKAYWDVDRQAARSVLDKSLEAAHSGLEETRRALKALRASPLEDMGLALAITRMAEDAASRARLELEMPEIVMMPPLSPDVEQAVYRVAQEAVTNVVKHAGAKRLTVRLESLDGKVRLTVQDDGVGFNAGKSAEAGRFGLAGMRERAHIAGGELSISSAPGSGTTVQLTVESRP